VFRLKSASLPENGGPEFAESLRKARAEFDESLDDDLNTSRALGVVFESIRACNTAMDEKKLSAQDRNGILEWFDEVDNRLAIIPAAAGGSDEQDAAPIEALIQQRHEARRNRDFGAADRIRQELLNLGVLIEDTPQGTRWRRK
jgi:cysteinyl-tRNA synthetase